uniref:Transmembrane protein n=1 Tax=viral metagenome TaxID=1070528 RepID=A0A6M3IYN7_9ZZZZ
MKQVLTKKQIMANGIVFGIMILCPLIILSFLIPILGIPLLVLFIVIWPIAWIMRLSGIKNIHFLGDKFIEKD